MSSNTPYLKTMLINCFRNRDMKIFESINTSCNDNALEKYAITPLSLSFAYTEVETSNINTTTLNNLYVFIKPFLRDDYLK